MPALIHTPVPFVNVDEGAAAVIRGPGDPAAAGGMPHTGHLQWAWDFAVFSPVAEALAVLSVADGVVVDYASGFIGSDHIEGDRPDFGLGNFMTLRHDLGDGRVVYATYSHLLYGSMPFSGTGDDLRGFEFGAGETMGVGAALDPDAEGSDPVPHVQVHFGTSVVTLEQDGHIVVIASGMNDLDSPVAFGEPGFAGAGQPGSPDWLPPVYALDVVRQLDGTDADELLSTVGSNEAIVDPGGGNDTVLAMGDGIVVLASAGNDRIDGRNGWVTVDYSAGPALMLDLSLGDVAQTVGSGDSDVLIDIEHLIGSDFGDMLTGNDWSNHLEGQGGGDTLMGGAGQDTLRGAGGDDVIYAGTFDDTLFGGAGFDTLDGETQSDVLLGGLGEDLLLGGLGEDVLFGEEGVDVLSGDEGDDSLAGGDGNDVLHGGEGDDLLAGQAGADTLFGGDGADVFLFRDISDSPADPTARDQIADLDAGDRIDLSRIDAIVATADDDAFVFVGAQAFSGTAGELSFIGTLLAGDIDGDGLADFAIEIVTPPGDILALLDL